MKINELIEVMNFIEDGCGDKALAILHEEVKRRKVSIFADENFQWHIVQKGVSDED